MKFHLFILCNLACFGIFNSQINLGGMCHDKAGNVYCAGSFENIIDLGENTYLESAGFSEVFITKSDNEGKLVWASHFGDKHSISLNSITCDPYGNTYICGGFDTSLRFRNFKLMASLPKAFASPNFYLAKLNASGDPVWIKSSKNKGSDEGWCLTNDANGNIFVAGTFDNTFDCDDKTIVSTGNTDVFVLKLKSDGTILWLKNLGDEGENSCNALYVHGTKLYLGIGSTGDSKYKGALICLNETSGDKLWSNDIGTHKGSVDAICVDQDNSILISGFIQSENNVDAKNLIVAKYASNGENIWTKQFTGGLPGGLAIVSDEKNNIYLAGEFCDSLRLGKYNQGGYPKEDVFLAKLNSSGTPLTLSVSGNSKIDKGTHLHIWNDKLYMGGTFTDGLNFGNNKIRGLDNSIFLARFETLKNTCESLKLVATESLRGNEIQTTNIYGKLLIASGSEKNFLSEQGLHLENQKGDILKRTITDEKGDFSFKNIDSESGFNLVIETNDKLKETDEIFLATQTGYIVNKITVKDKKFVYPIIPAEISKLEELIEEDISLKFSEFGSNGGKEFMVTERISYEPNSWTIPNEALPYLLKVSQYMKKFSRTRLEINSHTDAQGDEEFNLKLSKVRAEEVKEFLVKNKVSPNKITIIGHGEENILNRCQNGIKCSESEHAFNRRIEFRFYLGSGL